MYIDGLVFFSESVPLLRTKEFNMYNVSCVRGSFYGLHLTVSLWELT